jgi:hypothetical protein
VSQDKGFVTKGSEEYFAEREANINKRIVEAKTNIAAIEARVQAEIAEIVERRDRLRTHLEGFITARNELVGHRQATIKLITELQQVVGVCDAELPTLDRMLDSLETSYETEVDGLNEAEKSRSRQLKKHERAKTRYELRSARLAMRKKLFFGQEEQAPVIASAPSQEFLTGAQAAALAVSREHREVIVLSDKAEVTP